MQFSIEQEKVINTRNRNLLVSAAAGSGKTAVLVERVIRMITDRADPVSIDALMIMTFTRAAAEEMRERIGQALRQKIAEQPEDQRLRTQYALLQRARISTIDSICQSILRQNYERLDIDPGFRAADEAELRLLKGEVMDQLLEEQYEAAAPEFMQLMEAFKLNRDDRLREVLQIIYDKCEASPWPERTLQSMLETAQSEAEGRTPVWEALLVGTLKKAISGFRPVLSDALLLCREADGPFHYTEGIEADLALIDGICGQEDYDSLYARIASADFPKLSLKRPKVDEIKKKRVSAVHKEFREYWQAQIRQFLFLTPEEYRALNQLCGRQDMLLLSLTREYRKRFMEAKKEKNIVDFGDMEHFALALLYEERDGEMIPSAAADRMAQELKEIMIDEYQDSNEVQEKLLYALSAERFGRPNVFMVGDVKQSIYQFREASPDLFLDKYDRYGEDGKDVKIELNRNYRSRREVLDSVNDVFSDIMEEDFGKIRYDENAALKFGAEYYPEHDTGCRTELWVAASEATDGEAPDEAEEEEMDAQTAEYRSIALRILSLMGKDGQTPFQVTDRASGLLRPVRYRDITILMRSAEGYADRLKEVLQEAGIPAHYTEKKGYFSATEIETILALLRVIDNPHQDIPLAAVLRSPIGGFQDEELARICGSYYASCRESGSEPGDLYDALLASTESKVRMLITRIDAYRRLSGVVPVHVLIGRIYDETAYYHYVRTMPYGHIRRKNLDILLEKAENYADSSLNGLFNFTRYIDSLIRRGSDFGEAQILTEKDDVVRIMTMHGSKGLEFPVVILSSAHKRKREKDHAYLRADRCLGIGSSFTDMKKHLRYPGIKKALITYLQQSEQLAEELRILYVAMTRAREKLIISAAVKDPEEFCLSMEELRETLRSASLENGDVYRVPAYYMRSRNSYLEWILLSRALEKGSIEVHTLSRTEAAAKELLYFVQEGEILFGLSEEKQEEGSREIEETERYLHRLLSAAYPHAEETLLKPKVSVSEIKMRHYKEHEEDPDGDRYRAGMEAEYGSDTIASTSVNGIPKGALYGTAFHRVMELLDYQGTVKEQLAAIRESGRIDAESLSMVREEQVACFLASGIGQRMAGAYEKGRLKREQHFMVGIPASELSEEDHSSELQLLQGIIDAYIEEEDGTITLIDYKTDRKTEEELTESYSVQLKLYADALTRLTGKAVRERIIYSTFLKKELMVQ